MPFLRPRPHPKRGRSRIKSAYACTMEVAAYETDKDSCIFHGHSGMLRACRHTHRRARCGSTKNCLGLLLAQWGALVRRR